MKNFKILTAAGVFALLLCGCGGSPGYQKQQISEDPAKTAHFEALSQIGDPAVIARAAASEIAASNGGAKNRIKIAQYVSLEEVGAQGSDVIYNYTLSSGWANLKNSDRKKYLKFLQADIVNRSCNTPSSRILMKKGVGEVHRFFYDYPSSHLFDAAINEEFCLKAGL